MINNLDVALLLNRHFKLFGYRFRDSVLTSDILFEAEIKSLKKSCPSLEPLLIEGETIFRETFESERIPVRRDWLKED